MSRFALFNAFANGLPIMLRAFDGSMIAHASRIYGIRVESGYREGQVPNLFLVTFWNDSLNDRIDDVFIRTNDLY